MEGNIHNLNLSIEILIVIAILLVYIISAHLIEVFKVNIYFYFDKKKIKVLMAT